MTLREFRKQIAEIPSEYDGFLVGVTFNEAIWDVYAVDICSDKENYIVIQA